MYSLLSTETLSKPEATNLPSMISLDVINSKLIGPPIPLQTIINMTDDSMPISTELASTVPNEPPSLLMQLQSASRWIPMSVPYGAPGDKLASLVEILYVRSLASIPVEYGSTSTRQWTEFWGMRLVPRNYQSSFVMDHSGWMVFVIGWRSV